MSETPNILVLMADQLRQDALACYGNPLIRTPNLDRLAANGVRFTNAYCPTPICVASRMSFLTGQRAARHRFTANGPLPGPLPELPTLMTLLDDAGYYPQGVGKMHFGDRRYGFRSRLRMEEVVDCRADDDYLLYLKVNGIRTRYPQGLRDLLYYQPQTTGIPDEHSQSRWVADRSVEFLRQRAAERSGQPFFLWSSWTAPHPPFAPSAPYDRMYDPADLPLPIYADRPLSTIPGPARGHRARLQGAHLDPDRIRRIRALYAGQVTHVDACVGSVLDELDRLGLADDTVVLLVADHGDLLGDHGLSQKNVPYGPSVRIPMLLQWPGKTRGGTVCDDLVGLEDVLPTVVEALDLRYDSAAGPLPGRSLLGAAGGGLARDREHYVIDFGHDQARWLSVRSRTHAYSLWAAGGYEELYDLECDPHETQNLGGSLPELAAELREVALAWERRHGLEESFADGSFRVWPAAEATDMPPGVVINDSTWAEHLAADEQAGVETYAEAFTRAIRDETTLTPDKLDLTTYKKRGGNSLAGTPWEAAWKEA